MLSWFLLPWVKVFDFFFRICVTPLASQLNSTFNHQKYQSNLHNSETTQMLFVIVNLSYLSRIYLFVNGISRYIRHFRERWHITSARGSGWGGSKLMTNVDCKLREKEMNKMIVSTILKYIFLKPKFRKVNVSNLH